jgi:hypothetical protein
MIETGPTVKGNVVSFEPADKLGYPLWDLMEVEGEPTPFLVHHNWAAVNGKLSPGEEVEFGKTPHKVYSNSEYPFVKDLRRTLQEGEGVV